MSEHSHIDKIFKDGLGERNFANVDAMWQKMEAELDNEKGKKKRPFIFLFASAALIVVAGFFAVQYFNKAENTANNITAANTVNNKVSNEKTVGNNVTTLPKENIPVSNDVLLAKNDQPVQHFSSACQHTKVIVRTQQPIDLNATLTEDGNITATESAGQPIETAPVNDIYLEKITATADLINAPEWSYNKSLVLPLSQNVLHTSTTKVADRKDIHKPSSITIEAVGGGDLIRLNRKAGYYVGLRLNKKLETGTSVTVGLNFASHTISDRYRIKTKPAEQRSSDARINSISSVRLPIYLQRQMGNSKFAMMVGFVPTYITQAEVYNVPNSYIGDPDPYRKFDLDDIHRFNLLFGAGLRYSPTNWVALELSGSYGLTGMVKDGYKNLSRVNDNFKSIQLGVAFRIK